MSNLHKWIEDLGGKCLDAIDVIIDVIAKLRGRKNDDAFRSCLLEYESSKDDWYWTGPLFDNYCPPPPQSLIYLYDVKPLTGTNIWNFFQNYANARHWDVSYDLNFAISPSLSVTLNEKEK